MTEEGALPSPHEKIFVARKNGMPQEDLFILLEDLFEAARSCDRYRILEVLERIVPTNQFAKEGEGFEPIWSLGVRLLDSSFSSRYHAISNENH